MSSAEISMGVCDLLGRDATAIGLLITQRSRVQIPPRYQFPQVKVLSRQGEGLLRDRERDQMGCRCDMPRPDR